MVKHFKEHSFRKTGRSTEPVQSVGAKYKKKIQKKEKPIPQIDHQEIMKRIQKYSEITKGKVSNSSQLVRQYSSIQEALDKLLDNVVLCTQKNAKTKFLNLGRILMIALYFCFRKEQNEELIKKIQSKSKTGLNHKQLSQMDFKGFSSDLVHY